MTEKGRLNLYRLGLVLAVVGLVSYLLKINHLDWEDLKAAFPFLVLYLAIKLAILMELINQMSRAPAGRRSAIKLKKVLCVEIAVSGIAATVILIIWALFQIPRFF